MGGSESLVAALALALVLFAGVMSVAAWFIRH